MMTLNIQTVEGNPRFAVRRQHPLFACLETLVGAEVMQRLQNNRIHGTKRSSMREFGLSDTDVAYLIFFKILSTDDPESYTAMVKTTQNGHDLFDLLGGISGDDEVIVEHVIDGDLHTVMRIVGIG